MLSRRSVETGRGVTGGQHHRRPAVRPYRIQVGRRVDVERLLAVQVGGLPAAASMRCSTSAGQPVEDREEEFLLAAEVVIDAADTGTRMIDDIRHRCRGESTRAEHSIAASRMRC